MGVLLKPAEEGVPLCQGEVAGQPWRELVAERAARQRKGDGGLPWEEGDDQGDDLGGEWELAGLPLYHSGCLNNLVVVVL